MNAVDLVVVGGGSGGFGAALAAGRRGLRVLLVEAGPMLGGNSTLGGVNTWEPGIGGPGFSAELFNLLSRQKNAIGVSRTTKFYTPDQPWGFSTVDPARPYRNSLRRAGLDHHHWMRVTFEPDAMAAAMLQLLAALPNVEVWLGARFVSAELVGDRITSVVIERHNEQTRIPARFVVDATAQLRVCLSIGCKTYLGSEPTGMYGEPSAPAVHADSINGVTLCYRVAPVTPGEECVEPLPEGHSAEPFERPTSITQYPCGDLNMNPLPVLEGMEFVRLGNVDGRAESERRVRRHWHWMQKEKGFDRFKMVRMFPMMGVREGPRLIGRRVLSEVDVRLGCSGQKDADRWITLADHALDVHGQNGLCKELPEPYGVAFDCLLANEAVNLAVACRGASFTHIAAASCRLSRTMMQLGHAAGIAAHVANERGTAFPDVDMARVQAMLREDNVALTPEDPRFKQPGE